MKLEDAINKTAKKFLYQQVISHDQYIQFTSRDQNNLMYGLPNVPKQNSPLRRILTAFFQHSFNLAKIE